tara:strand:- start:198 stop:503 length:306 start_codon:yes stop_codon:yes gene_type:complete
MRKLWVIFLILSLILSTAFIKNSTKKVEDEIFAIKENLINLKKELGSTKLEYNYLSSADKLIEFQRLYFENDFIQKDINEIKIISKESNELKIKKFEFKNE